MKYNIKLNFLKKLKKISQLRPTIVYNIINKMVSHLNINGKKKKLIKVVFKFFQKYIPHTKTKHSVYEESFEKNLAELVLVVKNKPITDFTKILQHKYMYPNRKLEEKLMMSKALLRELKKRNAKIKNILEKDIKNSIQTILEENIEDSRKVLYKKKLKICAALNSSFQRSPYYKLNNFYINKFIQGFSIIFYQSRPLFDTKKVRKGPKYYDVPFKLKMKRSQLLILRWFSKAVKAKNIRSITLKLQDEIEKLLNYDGSTFFEILKLRKHVLDNLMYSHYRWWNRKKKK